MFRAWGTGEGVCEEKKPGLNIGGRVPHMFAVSFVFAFHVIYLHSSDQERMLVLGRSVLDTILEGGRRYNFLWMVERC